MTRDEAEEILGAYVFQRTNNDPIKNWVLALEKLGVLKFDAPPSAASYVEVIDFLTGIFVEVGDLPRKLEPKWQKTTRSGALEILDVLSKHGFVIMKQPNA